MKKDNFSKGRDLSIRLPYRTMAGVLLAGLMTALSPTATAADSNTTTTQQQDTKSVSGTVVDEKGNPVPVVAVRVTTQRGKGARTDEKGRFTINGLTPTDVLEVSFMGYETVRITVGSQTTLKIALKPLTSQLEEVVVVGYGTQKKVNLTGAVSNVDSKQLQTRPVQNVAQALQGVVPGLNFSVTNSGGALNSRLSMNIRGSGTIGEGSYSSPLVLIDGAEGDMNTLAANDIESISVLKDAASSAIYGSRAAFGVILITTKSGKEGKSRFSYNGNMRFNTATQIPTMMDSEMFANYFNRAGANAGEGIVFPNDVLEKIRLYKQDPNNEKVRFGTMWNAAKGEWAMYDEGNWANTNWFKENYRSNAPSQEHNVSFSGGTSKLNYYISGAFLDQEGLIRYGQDKFNRYNVSGKFSAEITPWFNITYNNRWIREDYSRPSYMTGLFFHNIARRWPVNAVTDPNGHLISGQETIQMRDGGKDINQKDFSNQQITFLVKPVEGWTIKLENNYNTTYNNNHWDVLPIFRYDKDGNPHPTSREGGDEGQTRVSESAWKSSYFNGRYFTEYSEKFGKHDVKMLGGLDIEISNTRNLGGNKKDLITPLVPTVNTATHDKPTFYGGYSHWATMGFFGRINYIFDDKYLFEASVRRDGSSRFIGDKRWGTFPTFAVGWNLSNESFWEPIKHIVPLLKVRGSWGALGNTNIQALYPWFLAQPQGVANSGWLLNGERVNTSNAPGIVSSSLTWERVESWNIALDFSLLNNRLQGSFDFFNRTTYDMVSNPEKLPSILGVAPPKINNTDMRSYGWDLEVRWRDQWRGLDYGLKLVLSDDQQEILRYSNPTNSLSDHYSGKKAGEIWGYTTIGIAKTDQEMNDHLAHSKQPMGTQWAAGDIMYKDLNGDGTVNYGNYTLDSHGDLSIIGNSTPRYKFGINADAAWKGIDFSIFLQGVGKRDWWDGSPYSVGATSHGKWQSVGFVEHWDFFRPEGDPLGANLDAYYPRPLFGKGGKNMQRQTRYLKSAAYMRIKNMQIGYSLPQSWIKKVGLSRVRVYTSVDNLVTFTKMTKIFDPEAIGGDWGPGKLYPLQRTWSFGVNVNF